MSKPIKLNCGQTNFDEKIVKTIWVKKKFWVEKKIFGQNFFWGAIKILVDKLFGSKYFLIKKLFVKKFLFFY